MKSMRASMLIFGLLCSVLASATDPPAGESGFPYIHFVPDSQRFWDYSKNWTTNFGPAYRDTVEQLENMVPCSGRYALCFNSGPEPLPCELTPDGRFANCKCTSERGVNFVLITAILNYKVYLDTVAVCGADGSQCRGHVDKAPVCQAIRDKKLIPGAQLISTFSKDSRSQIAAALANPASPNLTGCPKGPYAGCMTAPCRTTRSGDAECSCPVFWGPFQLTEANPQCSLEDGLVWSSSYSPALDKP